MLRVAPKLAAAVLLCLASWPANARPAKAPLIPLTVNDLVTLRDVGPSFPDPGHHFIALSPDHKRIAFQIRQADPETNRYRLSMLVLDLSATTAPIVVDEGGDVILQNIAGMTGPPMESGLPDTITPLWSRDGTAIYFLKRLNGSTQVWRASTTEKKSEAITQDVGDITDLAWANDGRHLIYASWRPDADGRAKLEKESLEGYRYDARFRPLSSSVPTLAPLKRKVNLSLDVVTGRVTAPSALDQGSFDQQAEETYLSPAAMNRHGQSVWIAKTNPVGAGLPTRLFVRDSQGATQQCRATLCTGASVVWWTKDDRRIQYLRRDGWGDSEMSVYEWEPGAPSPTKLYTTSDLLLDCQPINNRILCAREKSATPRQIVLIDPKSMSEKLVYDPNPRFGMFLLGQVERLHWHNSFGVQSFGDLVYPVGYVPGKTYPLLITQYISRGFLRGGMGDEFPIQLFANRGYAVLNIQRPKLPDPPVPPQTEAEANHRLLEDFKDRQSVLSSIEIGAEQLIRRGIVDRERIGITGLSDGSSTVQFAAVNSKLFKAGSATGCCWDEFQDSFLGPEISDNNHQVGWPRLADRDTGFWDHISLVDNAKRIHFPLLIQQSDDEYRGAVASVTALKQAGNPVSLYVFPNEHHIKWQPAHRVAVYSRNIRWFDFWLRGIGSINDLLQQ
jgi:dipeptidyl aminopeptidase/acylaminoacyl peptidase